MKKIISLLLAVSMLLSFMAVAPVAAAEDLEVYWYEDFVTGYEEGETRLKTLDGANLERSQVDGEYVLKVKIPSGGGYQASSFTKSLKIEKETKAIVEFKVSGSWYGGSNYMGAPDATSIPMVYFWKTGIKLYSQNDSVEPNYIANCDLNGGVTITLVYDNEDPIRDIFVDGHYVGTYDMRDKTNGNQYCDNGVLQMHFYHYLQEPTVFKYHYLKAYEAPADYSPETFVPSLYKNIGKPAEEVAGIIEPSENYYFDIINGLGFYNAEKMGDYQPDAPMSRLGFASVMIDMLKIPAVAKPIQIYKDIALRHYMTGELEGLHGLGIMRGVAADTFGVEEDMTLAMASAAMIRALGYKELAEYNSGYSLGYITMADQVGLLKGVPKNGTLTQKDIMRMLYNFMNTDIYETVGIVGDSYLQDSTKGKTILKVYHNIVGIKDVLTANKVTALTSVNGTDDDAVIIGETRLRTTDNTLNGCLGYEVEAYYNAESETIIFGAVTAENNGRILDAADIIGYADGKISYTENEKEYTLAMPVSADIIFNGKAEPFKESIFDTLEMGNVTFIDNNNDNKYEVAIIQEYVNRVLDAKANDGKVLRFKEDKGAIRLESYDSYDIRSVSGKPLSFESLSENNVLSIMESTDKSYVLILVGTNSAIGKLEELYSEENKTYLTINGETLQADLYFAGENAFLKTGITGEFFKDAFGKIAYYTESITNDTGYAYLIGLQAKDSSFEDSIKIKIYTEYEQMLILETADKITIDGVSSQPAKSLLDYAPLYNITTDEELNEIRTFKTQLISYKLNSAGQISAIDTSYYNEAYENPDNTLIAVTSGYLKYDAIDKAFGESLYLSSDCKVFEIPSNNIGSAEADKFGISEPSKIFRGDSSYNVWGYKTKKDSLNIKLLVGFSRTGGGLDSYSYGYVVQSITDVYDVEEDELYKKLTYLYQGKQKSCIVRDASYVDGIEFGDVVILAINSDNELVGSKLLYDLDADTDDDETTVQVRELNRGAIHRVMYGTIYETTEGIFTITKDPTAANVAKEVHRIPSYIYVIDRAKGKVTIGSSVDIIDYQADSENATKAVFYETKGYDYGLFIIK